MEALNRRLADRVDLLINEVKDLRQQSAGSTKASENPTAASNPGFGTSASSSATPGSNASGRDPSIPSYNVVSGTRARPKAILVPSFGPGFQLESENQEYQLQFHQETQVDYREFDPNGEEFARSGFYVPRLRAFFNGRVTKQVDYMFSVNKGFGEFNVLDAWVNFHNDERLQLKIGRYMTPFNYEQFAIQNMWLTTPERSLFTQNLGLNRQIGATLWGYLFDNRLDYALAIFDGPRNSFQDYNESKDIFTYLNIRPFQKNPEGSLLRNLNIGGSAIYGDQDNPLRPNRFRVAANASNDAAADQPAPPFLSFVDNVRERGQRTFWSGHVSYFYKSLSLLADYNGAILHYGLPNKPAISLPASGYSVTAGYFVTGEQMEKRTTIDPLRTFSLKKGSFGLGAIELVGRYNTFEIDNTIFSSGLSDPDLWSNRAWSTNIGFNWYPNRYLKFYFDWQHSEFGNPVKYAEGRKALSNDLYWIRTQFYF